MITLKMTNDDYYDDETDEYVMTVGSNIPCLHTSVKIEDYDGTKLECYLSCVIFIQAEKRGRRDKYELRYKVY